jgi:hypothetical protein
MDRRQTYCTVAPRTVNRLTPGDKRSLGDRVRPEPDAASLLLEGGLAPGAAPLYPAAEIRLGLLAADRHPTVQQLVGRAPTQPVIDVDRSFGAPAPRNLAHSLGDQLA